MHASHNEFNQMCSQEALGLTDSDYRQGVFHGNFIAQLQLQEDETYSTRLPCKPDHPTLPSNKNLTLARLQGTTCKLERIQKLEEYHTVMEQQLEQGFLELAPEPVTGEVTHYIPHHPVIREETQSTKMRIMYDCSAKSDLIRPL